MLDLLLKPTIAADELDGVDTFCIFALVFPKPAASWEGTEGESTRDPDVARVTRVGCSGRHVWPRLSGRDSPAARAFGLASEGERACVVALDAFEISEGRLPLFVEAPLWCCYRCCPSFY